MTGELGRVESGETVVRMYCMMENKEKKRKKKERQL